MNMGSIPAANTNTLTFSQVPVGKPVEKDPNALDDSSFKPVEESTASGREKAAPSSTDDTARNKQLDAEQARKERARKEALSQQDKAEESRNRQTKERDQRTDAINDPRMETLRKESSRHAAARAAEINSRTLEFNQQLARLERSGTPPGSRINQRV
jgi:hypothetical protein